ncbi:MAG TPA: PTS transporter subunit EIIB, partial [Terrimicrobiaceae bacterium]|nr:PTS transporter subunit EIIB [Terrimicrobiaceae bacterium]
LIKALGGKANIQRVDACAETRLRVVTTNGALDEAALRTAGVEAIVKLPDHVIHLLTGLNADQYAAEMRGQLAKSSSGL